MDVGQGSTWIITIKLQRFIFLKYDYIFLVFSLLKLCNYWLFIHCIGNACTVAPIFLSVLFSGVWVGGIQSSFGFNIGIFYIYKAPSTECIFYQLYKRHVITIL